MRVLHLSDCHGKLPKGLKSLCPDLLILSGDICPHDMRNFTPGIKNMSGFYATDWFSSWNFRQIDAEAERKFQNAWIEAALMTWIRRKGIPLSNVIVVRGNHDWADFEKYFENGLNTGARTSLIKGKLIGTLAGVPPYTGEWQDEVKEEELAFRLGMIDPGIDFLVSHVPPRGILDGYIGSSSVETAVLGSVTEPPLFKNLTHHFFGHSHETRGVTTVSVGGVEEDERNIVFSNAAETYKLIEIP